MNDIPDSIPLDQAGNDQGAQDAPPAGKTNRPRRGRKAGDDEPPAGKTNATADDSATRPEPPPWPNFAEVPDQSINTLKTIAIHSTEADLIPAEGFARYVCLKNCGNGMYTQGRTYTLPEGQSEVCFRKL